MNGHKVVKTMVSNFFSGPLEEKKTEEKHFKLNL